MVPIMKKLMLAFFIGLSITGLFMQYSDKVQRDIASNILRLHIVANSDDPADQALKLKVRDRIISYLSDKVENCDLNETKEIVAENIDAIKQQAESVIQENGYSYSINAQVGKFNFPTKHYDNFSLPRGNYEALRVAIGSGKGQNWWCVLYPNLCFVNGVVAMPDSSQSRLKGVLTEDEISLISNTNSFPITLKFKLVELFSNMHI